MDVRIQELLHIVGETADRIELQPEDLAIYLGESMGVNCPEIYRALRE